MTSDTPAEKSRGLSQRTYIVLLLLLVFVIDLLAMQFVPPYDPQAEAGAECAFPVCYINGNLELPAPHVVWPEDYSATGLIVFEPSITSTLVTMWGVMIVTILTLVLMSRGRAPVPGKAQNAIEHVWELLEGFASSLGGPGAKPYIPLFAGFFIFILFCNWSGLLPFIGKVNFLRAPTSDVNITIGLALVAFVFFEYQGFRALGVRGYLSKFFPFGEFRKGVGAGIIAVFVGLIELLLEFVKPVTLSMRLFGNIYGGEVALAVLTALTIAIIPMAMIALELMLNLVQALIFATLTLMFTLAAMEHHGDEEHHEAAEHPTEPAAWPVDPDQVVQGI
ncbi:MAG: F0F1 ATP synthase subunit A [Chloroflexi bacterium]|nr:F0F1 ATP synthase subunit A [Chloroflexota bacterium]